MHCRSCSTCTGPLDRNLRTSENERVGQGMSRERGARDVLLRAHHSPHLQRCAVTLLQHAEASRQPSWLPRLLPLPNKLFDRVSLPLLVSSCRGPLQQPRRAAISAARGCRSPEDPGRARRGISRTGRTHEALRTKCGRHSAPRSGQREGGILVDPYPWLYMSERRHRAMSMHVACCTVLVL